MSLVFHCCYCCFFCLFWLFMLSRQLFKFLLPKSYSKWNIYFRSLTYFCLTCLSTIHLLSYFFVNQIQYDHNAIAHTYFVSFLNSVISWNSLKMDNVSWLSISHRLLLVFVQFFRVIDHHEAVENGGMR